MHSDVTNDLLGHRLGKMNLSKSVASIKKAHCENIGGNGSVVLFLLVFIIFFLIKYFKLLKSLSASYVFCLC